MKPTRSSGSFRASLSPAEVQDTLVEGLPTPLLLALGLVDRAGRATADAARKIKQINHFIRAILPALDDVFERHDEPILVDAAAGKSYLGLAIHAVAIHRYGRGRMIAVEARSSLTQRVETLARELGYERFETLHATISEANLPERLHFVVALHACDTATDEALLRALRADADHIALVPCCQAELARLWKQTPPTQWAPLVRHPWHRREFGAHATNVLRALVLEAHGYQTRVTELAGWEHTVKNELIMGRRVGRFHRASERTLDEYIVSMGVRPWLVEQLASPPSARTSPDATDTTPEAHGEEE
jgi:hypothetical protein